MYKKLARRTPSLYRNVHWKQTDCFTKQGELLGHPKSYRDYKVICKDKLDSYESRKNFYR